MYEKEACSRQLFIVFLFHPRGQFFKLICLFVNYRCNSLLFSYLNVNTFRRRKQKRAIVTTRIVWRAIFDVCDLSRLMTSQHSGSKRWGKLNPLSFSLAAFPGGKTLFPGVNSLTLTPSRVNYISRESIYFMGFVL